ncbi:MAG: DUF5011 domain-containing protein [Lachnospiraceae bacterium]|nr:DUF5011 domain-containing protein [Lachnospiraceae bacterium]
MKIKRTVVLAMAVIISIYGFQGILAFADNDAEYLIRINVSMNCITVYGKNSMNEYEVPVKAMACSVYSSNIDGGVSYAVTGREEWSTATDGTYLRLAVKINETTAICTAPYRENMNSASLITEKYNDIGDSYSSENIWLNYADAKWIYDNCIDGTIVELYSNTNEAGPLGKPDTIKLPDIGESAKWDPTDEAAENPWKQKSAYITGMRDIETVKGEDVDFLKGIKGYDTCGNDVTDRIIIMGNYDLNKEGTYTITYYLMDAVGSQASESTSLTVKNVDDETTSNQEQISNKDNRNKSQKSDREKLKTILILAAVSLIGAWVLIRYTNRD